MHTALSDISKQSSKVKDQDKCSFPGSKLLPNPAKTVPSEI